MALAASVACPLQLAGIAAAAMLIAWMVHIGIWFLKRDEKIYNTA